MKYPGGCIRNTRVVGIIQVDTAGKGGGLRGIRKRLYGIELEAQAAHASLSTAPFRPFNRPRDSVSAFFRGGAAKFAPVCQIESALARNGRGCRFVQYCVRRSFLDGTDFGFCPPKESFSGRPFVSPRAFGRLYSSCRRLMRLDFFLARRTSSMVLPRPFGTR